MGYGKMSNYPNGFNYGVSIRNMPVLTTFGGDVYWVDSNAGSNGNKGTFDQPFSTLDYAVGRCTANNGDIIFLKPGHVETVIAAGGLDLDVAGITVIFLGEGTDKAYVTFTTAVTADMDVDAANVTLVNPKFVAGKDSLTGPVDVNSTDFTIINGEWHDATDIETTDCVVATAGATRLCIDGWKFFCGTETAGQKQSNIQINGCDNIILRNIDIRGDFAVGCIENVTDEVLNARFENLNLENLNADPQPAIYLDANATGMCRNVKLRVASGTTYANSYAKLAWDNQSEGFSGTSAPAGDALGTASSSGIEGQVSQAVSEIGSVGVKASTAVSEIGSVGVKASTAISEIGSVGVVASTGSARASTAVSEIGSVGVKASTAISEIGSVGVKASTAVSEIGSVGVKASTAVSEIGSVGVVASTASARASTAVSEIGSVGVKTSTILSAVHSLWTAVSIKLSVIDSQVT